MENLVANYLEIMILVIINLLIFDFGLKEYQIRLVIHNVALNRDLNKNVLLIALVRLLALGENDSKRLEFILAHRQKCKDPECKCHTLIMIPSDTEKDSKFVRRQSKLMKPNKKSTSVTMHKIFATKDWEDKDMKKNYILFLKLLIQLYLKREISQTKTGLTGVSLLYIFVAYILKTYENQLFLAFFELSNANDSTPSFYNKFLIFCFRYLANIYIYIYIYIELN